MNLKAPGESNRKASIVQAKGEEEEETGAGHDAPNWSRSKSTFILLGATLLYAIIAEILVDNVDSVLADFAINPKFLAKAQGIKSPPTFSNARANARKCSNARKIQSNLFVSSPRGDSVDIPMILRAEHHIINNLAL
ncbi:hypothetical protein QCA50_015777 [Cerrena zonata]|uniref:Uncharacterized protein n=1 Tax=Cerrena zonata TaxID=2478898 RepID=A0AAW0FV68_9APHY